MTSTRRYLALLSAFFVLPLALSACGGGGGVPGNAVVKIGSDSIKTSEFDHWLKVAATSQQQQTGATGAAAIPQPPEFKACIATKKKTATKPAKGQPTPTDATYKAQCKQEYDSLRDQVMQFLILEKWVAGEAKNQGVKVDAKTAEADFQKARKQSFPKASDFQTFLKNSGMTVADARFQVRFNTVYTKLREKAVKNADKVTNADILAFYKKNKARLGTPLTRDLRVVLTRDKSTADKAKSALQAGQSWTAVVKKYSIDPATKATGGVLSGLSKGQQEPTFDKAIFSAPKKQLEGPIKTQFGYYVFEVQKETPASQQTLKQATPAIRQQLDAQNKQKADDTFNTQLRKKWKAKTNCADAFVMTQCKNAPKEKTTATAGGAAQTVPQP
jgi:foldase protein PrsA